MNHSYHGIKKGFSNNMGTRSWILSVFMCFVIGVVSADASMHLVEEGQATAVIVIQGALEEKPNNETIDNAVQNAIDELQYHLERATGTRLPVVTAGELSGVPESHVRILIGPGSLTESLGLSFEHLPEETYWIESIENYLVLSGQNPQAIQWSVHRFVDQFMGVRWLWPGEIGTYVPQTSTVSIPADVGVVSQPPLQWRHFSMRPPEELREEISTWLMRHMTGSGNWPEGAAGNRGNFRVSHGFTHWIEEYYEEHPDLFARERGPYTHRRIDGQLWYHIHLCLSNPKVDEFIIKEWLEAGAPDYWNIGNNDLGGRYCLCDDCRSMDKPPNQSWDDLWAGTAYVTARHVKFWRRLRDKMQAINPNVVLGAYAFQQYRFAPPPGTDLEDMVISVVSAHDEYEDWLAWYETGARLYLRPNWWHTGVVAPHIPLYTQGKYFKLAYKNGMEGYAFDSLIGYWGAQGPSYYLITRLGYRPDLAVDEIISEYTDAFGSAKPAIREYLDYWIDRTEKANYRLRSTDMFPPREGLYDTIVEEQGFRHRVQHNNWLILPYLYPDEVVAEAHAILDRAELLAADDGQYVQDRIQFLRDAMRYLETAREVFRLGIEGSRPDDSDETWEKYVQAREKLEALRDDVISPHVVWDGISERQRDYRPWDILWERD